MKDIIDKAVKGGFIIFWQEFGDYEYGRDGIMSDGHGDIQYEYIYLRHDFLKAYFGEHQICEDCSKEPAKCWCRIQYTNPAWMVYAQKLVLSTDRKEYLRRFV